ncbi:2OG-Fe(II) oxygenase [Sulfitobacter sp. SK012]|nr:2OG-Fe(II) oxygenase [Sulfitobacter sp. SK012]
MAALIDLDRYPLDRPDRPAYRDLVARCQAELAQDGLFNLEGFLREDARTACVDAVMPRFAKQSFRHARRHNIYFRKDIPELPDDHPALQQVETVNHTLCGDVVEDTAVTEIYEWLPFAAFLADVMEKPALYPMDDALSRLNVMAYRAGEALNWHFDRSEFTTTLLLQAPQEGGGFEYARNLRRDDDPNYAGVTDLLTGKLTPTQMHVTPGTLNVFRGKNTAHRVTPVAGDIERVITVFTFYEHPGAQFSDTEKMGFYGRTS